MSERIGFYICHCGINIAYRVRVKEVAEYAATLPNVAVSRDYLFMCSDPGQELIENDIRTHDLTRIVVASCSPRMHEKTFRGACERAGLNPYRAFHMVCEREHVSWVTEDETEMFFTRTHLGTPDIFRSLKVNGTWTEPELIVSQFAGEPTLDSEGNLYFTHHFYEDGEMIEADIYYCDRI